jgi:hypothetical protein
MLVLLRNFICLGVLSKCYQKCYWHKAFTLCSRAPVEELLGEPRFPVSRGISGRRRFVWRVNSTLLAGESARFIIVCCFLRNEWSRMAGDCTGQAGAWEVAEPEGPGSSVAGPRRGGAGAINRHLRSSASSSLLLRVMLLRVLLLVQARRLARLARPRDHNRDLRAR